MTSRAPAAVSEGSGSIRGLRLLAGGLPMTTGAALVVHIAVGTPLWALVVVTVPMAVAAWAVLMRSMPEPFRRRFSARVRVGAVAGLAATLAYDSIRYGLVAVANLSVSPFEAYPLFGWALVGADIPIAVATAVGAAFHLANGTGFAMAYVLLARRPRMATAVAFALGLEAAMLLTYPTWLDIVALDEFLTMSGVGHIAYGVTLGLVAGRLLARASAARAWQGSP